MELDTRLSQQPPVRDRGLVRGQEAYAKPSFEPCRRLSTAEPIPRRDIPRISGGAPGEQIFKNQLEQPEHRTSARTQAAPSPLYHFSRHVGLPAVCSPAETADDDRLVRVHVRDHVVGVLPAEEGTWFWAEIEDAQRDGYVLMTSGLIAGRDENSIAFYVYRFEADE